MAKSLAEKGKKFLENNILSKKLVDAYNREWIEQQYKDNPNFFFIDLDDFDDWVKKSKGKMVGHLYLLKIENGDADLKREIVLLFPWMAEHFSAPIGPEAIHEPDIIFFNNAIQSVYILKLGRHSRFMSVGPFNAMGKATISIEQFMALDFGGIVSYLEDGLSELGEAYEELAGSDLDDESYIEQLCEAIEDAQQPIGQFFEVWELDTDDY